MENFIYDIPTRVYFGRGQLKHLPDILQNQRARVLFVYGSGSIVRSGLYDEVKELLAKAGNCCFDLPGVEPNPSIDTVRAGVQLCYDEAIDLILAVGGGSVIDCAKVIAAGACVQGDSWELVIHPEKITRALPVIAVSTNAATGSEMDHIAVITNPQTKEKIGTRHQLLRPVASIMDPTYTFTLSSYQTACGIADIMSHAMESYFVKETASLQDHIAEGILKICRDDGLLVLEEPENYEARANLMWASAWAINDMLKLGHMTPWSVHPMEHPLSAYYNVTHGEGLAILTPHWMSYVLSEETVDKFARFAREIWKVPEQDPWDMARKGIEALQEFYYKLGLRTSLGELGIDERHFTAMAKDAAKQTRYGYVSLDEEDVKAIYKHSL